MGEKFGKFALFKHLMKKFWRIIRSDKGLLIVSITLDGLVWRIMDDSPNLPNFPPPNFSINGTSMALPHNNYVKTFEGEKFCEFVVL